MPAINTFARALLVSVAIILTSAEATTTSSSTSSDVCASPTNIWQLNNRGGFCCPGVLDLEAGEESSAYCCFGAPHAANGVVTTTQTSCATKISLFPTSDYTSRVSDAVTKYGLPLITNNPTTTSTGAAGGARITAAAAFGGAIVVVGGGLLV